MRYISVSLLVASAVMGTPAIGQTDQVKRGPVPAWVTPSELLPVPDDASGPVFLRRQDVLIHLDGEGQAQHLGYRIRILHPNALQVGNLSVAWNPGAGAPTVHMITVHRDGRAIDVLQSTAFEVLRREDQLEAAQLDGMLTAVLRVPDLRVGDELEFAVTIHASDPTLGKNDAGILLLGPNPPPGRFKLGLSWDAARAPTIKMTPDMTAIAHRAGNALEFRVDNPAAQSPPKDAPPRFQWQRAVEYSNFKDWQSLSRLFAPLYARAASLAKDSPLKAEAARIAAAHPGALARAGAALKLVQQDVRYIYVGLNGGNLKPATADETWARRYGDCKGKTALLLALLGELGVEAEAVLVNSSGGDDGLSERLPSPQMFDHVQVRATIDGVAYWLDGTLPPVAPPASQPVFPLKTVLPVRAAGAALESLPWTPAAVPDELSLYEADAREGFDKPARITTTSIVRGIKGLQQQVQFSALSSGQLLNGFRQQLIGDAWQSIDDVKWRYDQKAGASVLVITGTGTVDWDDDGDGVKSMALPGGGFSPPEKRVRSSEQDQDLPYYNAPSFGCHVTTIRLPRDADARHWTSKPAFDQRLFGRQFYRALELRDGAIRMVRGSRVEQQEIAADVARRDNARIASFDNSMAWITYNIATNNAAVGDGKAVPATYDIDWTSSDVPCGAGAGGK